MKFDPSSSQSGDLVDRRGQSGGGLGGLGGLGLPMGTGAGGRGGCLLPVLVLVIGLVFGGSKLLDGSGLNIDTGAIDQLPQAPTADDSGFETQRDDQLTEFMRWLATDVNDMWSESFNEAGRTYDRTKVVLFSNSVRSGCGNASATVGPFYCPADSLVYLDTDFFAELSQRFGAPGDFAQAYVIAHEVGHHVQNLLGISSQVSELQSQNPDEANQLSVRLELQADCLAGVYGHSTWERQLLEAGDLEEGIRAAAAVGDDSLQEQATGQVHPESFTHGTSDQRVAWFRNGFDSGDADRCDTFSGDI